MNKFQLKKYIKGYEMVAKIDAADLKKASLISKFYKILSISQLGIGLAIARSKREEQEIKIIRSRWQRLRMKNK